MKRFINNYRSTFQNRSRGFTLIELLVVIAVIGILASVMVANFVNVRYKTRDGVRKKDLEQIRLALETYRIDVGSYPLTIYSSTCPTSNSLINPSPPNTVYMDSVPCDPMAGTPLYGYIYTRTSNLTYTLRACLENANDTGPKVQNVATGTCPEGKRLELANP